MDRAAHRGETLAAVVTNDDDRSLVVRIGEGEALAFEVLMRRHLAFVLRLAQRMIGNPTDADEIAQEAFLTVWRTAPRWRHDGDAQFKTWLYRVVVNLCLDRRRRRQPDLPLEAIDDPLDPGPSSLDRVCAGETARLVAQAVEALPSRQKAAILLCYYAGVNGAEAAGILEVSVSALESLLVRGRRALRLSLAGVDGILGR